MNESSGSLAALSRQPTPGASTAYASPRVPAPPSKWRTRIALPGLVVLVTLGLIVAAAGDTLWPRVAVNVVPVIVKTDVAAQPTGSVVVQAPGWVEADPFPVGVSALANGVVSEVLVLEGEHVDANQVVARLVPDDARIALAEAEALLAQRRAALEAAEAELVEAQRNWDHPIELRRQRRTAEAKLAETKAELDRWPAELKQAEAHAVFLEAEVRRIEPLYQRGRASEIEMIQARQALAVQRALVDATQKREAVLAAQIAALVAEADAARENLELRIVDTRALAEAKADLRLAEAAVAAAQADVDDARLRYARMEVRSPAEGIVMARLAEPGSKLLLQMDNPHSAQVVRLYDPNSLQLRVDVPLVDAAKVSVGQEAEVIVDVLPDKVYQGRITRVVHEADLEKNTLQVKVAIADPTPEIKPEMLARARFLAMAPAGQSDVRERAEFVLAPQAAVLQRDGAAHVWVADQVEGVARLKPVSLRPGRGDWVIVDEGLRPGDRVIINPSSALSDGQRITLRETKLN